MEDFLLYCTHLYKIIFLLTGLFLCGTFFRQLDFPSKPRVATNEILENEPKSFLTV